MAFKIPFNVPPFVGTEVENLRIACEDNHKICGDGPFTRQCKEFLEQRTGAASVLLTTSGTDALELAALLTHVGPGDEVIMPSYTFCSTADAFVLRGAVPVFVDIRPDTMNIDENLIEDAITERTKVIVAVHYAGVACEMDTIMDIARRHNLQVVEDAAQAVNAYYKGQPLGTIGDFGCYSFHETKNYSMGEGGALLVKDPARVEEAEILREKGTNRAKFFRGEIDKYTWVNYGSSYLPSELNAAYLMAQLDRFDEINENRLGSWNQYYETLWPLSENGRIELPVVPEECDHNAHMFYIKLRDIDDRQGLIDYLKARGILAVFHYIPLHSAPAGQTFCRTEGTLTNTDKESERLLRLPMFYGLTRDNIAEICGYIKEYCEK